MPPPPAGAFDSANTLVRFENPQLISQKEVCPPTRPSATHPFACDRGCWLEWLREQDRGREGDPPMACRPTHAYLPRRAQPPAADAAPSLVGLFPGGTPSHGPVTSPPPLISGSIPAEGSCTAGRCGGG